MTETTSTPMVEESCSRTHCQPGKQRMLMTFEQNTPKTIMPVIFIPGIFGSRLENKLEKGKKDQFVWDPINTKLLTSLYSQGKSAAVSEHTWSDKQIDAKVIRLHNKAATVMEAHNNPISSRNNIMLDNKTFARLTNSYDQIKQKRHEWKEDEAGYSSTLAEKVADEEYERRKVRGWYGVVDEFYAEILETINNLDDKEFIYPVFAFGYDWRFDLNLAAQALVDKIKAVKATQDYPDFGEKGETKDYQDEISPKVIIVTHSQGSIVARYALKKLGAECDVHAVIHLNQPTTGAPVLYRRFITGTAPERSTFGFTDNVLGSILGNSAYHFTRMAAPLTGALALLPTNDYLTKPGGAKHSWIKTEHAHLKLDKPITDIYTDVYLGDDFNPDNPDKKTAQWSLINCKRYDAQGKPKPYQESEFDIVQSTFEAGGETKTWQQPRHTLAPGELEKLSGVTILPAPADNPYQRDNQRLRPNNGMTQDNLKKAADYWKKFKENIEEVQTFHADLRLQQHCKTHVVRSKAVDTVIQIGFDLDKTGHLKCPLTRDTEGDGTVSLSSQESLLHQKDTTAQPAGPVIKGAEHAEICGNTQALKQVTALLTGEIVAEFRAKK